MMRVFFAVMALVGASLGYMQSTAAAEPVVTFTFDDVRRTVFTIGKPVLDKYGYRGTLYVTTLNTNNPGYMNWDDIAAATRAGWEIGAHTHTHANLTKITDAEIEQEFDQSMSEFLAHGYTPRNFATPFGAYDERVLSHIKERYDSHRTAWPDGVNDEHFDPYELKSVILKKTTTLEEVNSILEETWYSGGWLVFQIHDVSLKGNDVNGEYGTNLLEDVVEMVHKKGFAVRTVDEVLMLKQSTAKKE
jgi:peptidoglycan/xylan/chitin deacetylase (PgdA/CDA1 family)